MTDDDFLIRAAESLDDDVLKQLRHQLAQLPTPTKEYEYLVLADGHAKIYVSKGGVMTRAEIAAQLRRLADYVESLTDDQAHRP